MERFHANPLSSIRAVGTVILILGALANPVAASEAGTLRAATVKVDITPTDPTALLSVYQTPFTGVHDRTYARGVILDNGLSSAAIVSFDAVEISDGRTMVAHIAQETAIPAQNIILTATHDHTAPLIGLHNADGNSPGGRGATAFTAKVESDLVAALKQAKSNEQPAKIGQGQGLVSINTNRDLLTPAGKYTLGVNPDGPTDKTLRVIKLESLDGKPIAVIMNYAVHSTVLDSKTSLITGELAGAASRYVESHYDDKLVALWTLSAAGDQNPIARELDPQHPNSERNFATADALGQIAGAEAVRIADGIKQGDSSIKIWGAEKTVSCPGQKGVGSIQAGDRKLVDADPVSFRLGVLMIDQIAITSVSAEVVMNIYQHLRRESAFADTWLISLANGRIGYVPQDASYDNPTFEVYASPLRKGCGESAIVNGLMDMLKLY
jgi:neutral ceramidase